MSRRKTNSIYTRSKSFRNRPGKHPANVNSTGNPPPELPVTKPTTISSPNRNRNTNTNTGSPKNSNSNRINDESNTCLEPTNSRSQSPVKQHKNNASSEDTHEPATSPNPNPDCSVTNGTTTGPRKHQKSPKISQQAAPVLQNLFEYDSDLSDYDYDSEFDEPLIEDLFNDVNIDNNDDANRDVNTNSDGSPKGDQKRVRIHTVNLDFENKKLEMTRQVVGIKQCRFIAKEFSSIEEQFLSLSSAIKEIPKVALKERAEDHLKFLLCKLQDLLHDGHTLSDKIIVAIREQESIQHKHNMKSAVKPQIESLLVQKHQAASTQSDKPAIDATTSLVLRCEPPPTSLIKVLSPKDTSDEDRSKFYWANLELYRSKCINIDRFTGYCFLQSFRNLRETNNMPLSLLLDKVDQIFDEFEVKSLLLENPSECRDNISGSLKFVFTLCTDILMEVLPKTPLYFLQEQVPIEDQKYLLPCIHNLKKQASTRTPQMFDFIDEPTQRRPSQSAAEYIDIFCRDYRRYMPSLGETIESCLMVELFIRGHKNHFPEIVEYLNAVMDCQHSYKMTPNQFFEEFLSDPYVNFHVVKENTNKFPRKCSSYGSRAGTYSGSSKRSRGRDRRFVRPYSAA